MKTNRCFEIAVRFASPNHHQVRIDYRHGPTASQHLLVQNDGITLSIKYVDKDGDACREIVYNFAQVLEYECEGRVAKEAA